MYILISLVFLYLVPPERINSRETFAALTGEALFGRAGSVVLSLIVIVTVLGSLAALHSRYHTLARAVVFPAILASLLAVLGTFDEILAYFVVPTVVFVGLTVAAVFVLGRGARDTAEPVLVPWHSIPPLLLVPTAVLLALPAMNQPKHAGIGLAVVLLGLPVYHLLFTRLAPREVPGDGLSLAESSPASAAVETT